MKKTILISLIVVPILLVQIVILNPLFKKKDAIKTANNIFTFWQNENLSNVYDLWINPNSTPPLYGITSYNIADTVFYKENKIEHCRFTIILDFSEGNIYRSGKTWELTLIKTKRGWLAKNLLKLD